MFDGQAYIVRMKTGETLFTKPMPFPFGQIYLSAKPKRFIFILCYIYRKVLEI
jgi:hypothetical protein